MINPTLSIIMPVYNAEKYLSMSISSVLTQNYRDFEMILVDDGSTDGSAEICKGFSAKDCRVKYLSKANGGAASAKNYGMQHASGAFVEFVDADDYIDPGYTECLMNGMKSGSSDLCVGNIKFRNGEKGVGRYVDLKPGFFSVQEFLQFYPFYMPFAIVGAPYNKIFKLGIIRENGLRFNEKLSNNEDTHFNYDYLLHCKEVFVSDRPFYNYINWGGASLSHRYIPNLLEIVLSTYKKASLTLKQLDSYETNEQFCRKYFLRQVINSMCNEVECSTRTRRQKIDRIAEILKNDEMREILLTEEIPDLSRLESVLYRLIKKKKSRTLYVCFDLRKIKQSIKRAFRSHRKK